MSPQLFQAEGFGDNFEPWKWRHKKRPCIGIYTRTRIPERSSDSFYSLIRLRRIKETRKSAQKPPGIGIYTRIRIPQMSSDSLFLWFDFVESKKQRVCTKRFTIWQCTAINIKIIKGCADRCVKYVSVRERNVKLFLT